MRVGLFQYDIKWEDKSYNKAKITEIMAASRQKFDWIIFPEMTLTGFSFDPDKTTINEQDLDFFKNLAKKNSSYLSFGGISEGNNTVFTLDSCAKLINKTSKQHLFSYAGENLSYKAGKETPELFTLKELNVLASICYDLRFTYMFWEQARSVDLFFVIANWPESRLEHWRTLLRARAIENQAYVLGVNRIGLDKNTSYSGSSMAFDPMGVEILNAGCREGVFLLEIDKAAVGLTRERFPFLNDRKK